MAYLRITDIHTLYKPYVRVPAPPPVSAAVAAAATRVSHVQLAHDPAQSGRRVLVGDEVVEEGVGPDELLLDIRLVGQMSWERQAE